jgi:xanthine phosphoribosyltransferase
MEDNIMELLKQRIAKEGIVLNNAVLKVDSFLNHQLDPQLMMQIGEEFAGRFKNDGITKVVTIESSGIAVALTTALFLKVPVVFARKKKSILMTDDVFHTQVFSYTKKESNDITISKKFLGSKEKILIVDDFLASGEAALGMAALVREAGSQVAGIGIVIEKSFQQGRQRLLDAGYRVESLVRIESFVNNEVVFL